MSDKADPKSSMEKALERGGRGPSSVQRKRVDLERADAFIGAAGRAPVASTPIEGLDPSATPRIRFNIVLNDYEMAALRRRSERTGVSMQRIVRSLVVPVLIEGEETEAGS